MKRSRFLLATAALAAAPAVSRGADPFRIIITETQTPLVPNSVEELALRLGYYKKAGVDVELVRVAQTPSAIAALRSGGGDMANIGTDTALQLVARDQMRLRGVISPDKALPFLIVAKRAIAGAKALQGKSFGVARVGSVDYEMSRVVLGKLGVDVDRLLYLAVGQPAVRAQALAAGQIDATTISVGVWMTMPQRSAFNVLVDQSSYYKYAPFLSKINVVTADVDKTKSPQIAAVVRAIITASRDFYRDPSLWVNAMVEERPDVRRADLEALSVIYRKSWCVNGGINLDDLRFTADTLYANSPDFVGLRRVEPDEWIDTSYITALLKTIGNNRNIDVSGRG
jgi:NitT/TauT family transport system substrate-binding protein